MAKTTANCEHRSVQVAKVSVVACEDCGLVDWAGPTRPLDASEGLAALFGMYLLIGRFPAVHAPGPEVLMYRAPNRTARKNLTAFPAHVWLEVDDNLWLTHDGEHLLLVPTTPLLMDNLTREA